MLGSTSEPCVRFLCSCQLAAITAIAVLLSLFCPGSSSAADFAFQQWLAGMWPQAQAIGITRATFDAAIRGLEPDYSLPDLAVPGRPEAPQRGQPEFVE